MIYLKNKLP